MTPIPFAPGYFITEHGAVFSGLRGTVRAIKPWLDTKTRYLRVSLRVGGVTVKQSVHRIMAVTFLGPPSSEDMEVRHLDGHRAHNVIDNLAWGTHAENMHDMVAHGTHGSRRHPERVPRGDRHGSRTRPERVARGERIGVHKISEDDVRRLREVHKRTRNISKTARLLGLPRGATKCVIQGKTWTHVV